MGGGDNGCGSGLLGVTSTVKKLCALPCPYAEDYTNQEYRAFFELDSSDDLTCRTLLGYYFSDVAVSFFIQPYRKVTNQFTKKACW